jgi:hypothetical protein
MPPPIALSSLELSPGSGLARQPPRRPDQRQHGYDREFDSRTIFYDAFRSCDGDWIVLVGPPLANLELAVVHALTRPLARQWGRVVRLLARLAGRRLRAPIQVLGLDRTAQLWLRSRKTRIELASSLFDRTRLEIQPNLCSLFHGKNVLVTKSRDNELVWIRDWVRFHAEAHGCDAVLLYDNNSTKYRPVEIEQTIASVRGIDTVLVISWPFKWGPEGGAHVIWDSDYAEYGVLEHARHRFLATARAVVAIDIDELVLTRDGSSIFDVVQCSDTGYIHFPGRWIVNATSTEPDRARRRHKDYFYYDETEAPALHKWAVVPARCPPAAQWRIHDVLGMEPDRLASEAVTLRHFKAISTNWKLERWKPEVLDPDRHRMDGELAAWLAIFEGDQSTGGSRRDR